MMDKLSSVETVNLGKKYGGIFAIKQLSLQFRAGEISLLLGKNGAGKSTLLWVLSTLLSEDEGTIFYDGIPKSQHSSSDLRSHIGMLSHQSWCYPQLSALENLLFFASLYGFDSSQGKTLASTWLQEVDLDRAKHRPVRTFSQGMLQRLSLAKTLMHKPSIVLLDEPYNSVDAEGKKLITRQMLSAKKHGAIVILSTHDLSEISDVCDQVIVLERGRLLEKKRFTNPASISEISSLYPGVK